MIISDIPVGKIVELEVVIGENVHHINSKVEYGEGDELSAQTSGQGQYRE